MSWTAPTLVQVKSKLEWTGSHGPPLHCSPPEDWPLPSGHHLQLSFPASPWLPIPVPDHRFILHASAGGSFRNAGGPQPSWPPAGTPQRPAVPGRCQGPRWLPSTQASSEPWLPHTVPSQWPPIFPTPGPLHMPPSLLWNRLLRVLKCHFPRGVRRAQQRPPASSYHKTLLFPLKSFSPWIK